MTEKLSKHDDRCDRCGAEAFFRVWVPITRADTVEDVVESPAKDLLFCGHHARKYELEFQARGWKVDDFRDDINERPSVSANAE